MDVALAALGLVAIVAVPEVAVPVFLIEGTVVAGKVANRLSPAQAEMDPAAAPGKTSVYAKVTAAEERGSRYCYGGGAIAPSPFLLDTCATDMSFGYRLQWSIDHGAESLGQILRVTAEATFYNCHRTPGGDFESCDSKTTFGTILPVSVSGVMSKPIVQNSPTMYDRYAVLYWNVYDNSLNDFSGYDIYYREDDYEVDFHYYATVQNIQWTTAQVGGLKCNTVYSFLVSKLTPSSRRMGTTLSCSDGGLPGTPYAEVWDGAAFKRDNNVLSRAHDYLRLNPEVGDWHQLRVSPQLQNGVYKIRLAGLGRESTSFNQARLFGVDHQAGVLGVQGEDGERTTYSTTTGLRNPIAAFDPFGNSLITPLQAADGIERRFFAGDYVDVTFDKAGMGLSSGADIIILCKNCWKEGEPPYPYTVGVPFSTVTPRGVVSVWAKNGTGVWTEAGSIAPRQLESRYAVNVSSFLYPPAVGNFTLRLNFGGYHWVDYVGLDNTRSSIETWQNTALLSAVRPNGANVTAAMLSDDTNYAWVDPTQTLTLSFTPPPALGPGMVREFVLFTKGYFYPRANEIDASEKVTVTVSLTGTTGSSVAVGVSENAAGFGSTGMNGTEIKVGAGKTLVFQAYSNRSYQMPLFYAAASSGASNTLSVSVTHGSYVDSFNQVFLGSQGLAQVRVKNLDQYLDTTLNRNGLLILTKAGEVLRFEPINLVSDKHNLGWSSVTWVFGDGSQPVTTANRTVSKSYGQPGLYNMSTTITYEAGLSIVLTRQVSVFS